MFALIKKNSQEMGGANQLPGIELGPFVLTIPSDWKCINDNGTLRANKGDSLRLNISLRDITQVPDFSLDQFFETMKAGYYNADINWAAYSSITKRNETIYQTLEYLDEPRLILAAIQKSVDAKNLVIIISYAANSGNEIETNLTMFNNLLESIETI